jgi:cytochrome c-type biogenesis protein CcmH
VTAVRAALAVALALALAAPAAAATPRTTLPDVEDEVMCVECGTALNISQSPVAEQERAFIRSRIAEGRTKEQIKAALVEEYGTEVLATPQGGGFSAAAWAVPALLAALAALGVGMAARRWRRGTGAPPPAGPALDPADAQRLDADLAAHDR